MPSPACGKTTPTRRLPALIGALLCCVAVARAQPPAANPPSPSTPSKPSVADTYDLRDAGRGPYPCAEEILQGLENRPELSIMKYAPLPPPPPPDSECGWHFFIEGGFYLIHPYFSQNPGFTTAARNTAATQTTDLRYEVDFSPQATLGFVSPCGWGFRTSWWYFDQDQHARPAFVQSTVSGPMVQSAPINGVPGFSSPGSAAQTFGVFNDRFDFNDRLRLDVFDWEAIKDWRTDCWSLLAFGGARYTYLSQGYSAYRFNQGTARSGTTTFTVREDSDAVTSGHGFSGVGLTGGGEVRRRLGATGLSIIGSVRGSVIFGAEQFDSFQRTVENVQIAPTGSTSRTIATATLVQGPHENRGDTLPMLDAEVGLDWSRSFRRALLFLRAGVVNETWFGAGTGTSESGDLGFFGMRVTAGIHY